MHLPVLQLIRKRRSVTLSFSFIFITFFASQNTFAITTNEILSDESRLIIKDAQQQILNNKYQRALELSLDVLEDNPNQYQAQFIRAQALSHLGKADEAIKLYKFILKSHPTQPELFNNLANLYARQGKLELATETLEQGIATNVQYKTLYENLSAIYVEIARGAYSKALKLGVQAKSVQLKTLQVASLNKTALVSVVTKPTEKKIASLAENHKENSTQKNIIQENIIQKNTIKPGSTTITSTKSTQVAIIEKKAVVPVKLPIKVTTVKPSVKTAVKINKDEVVTALQGWAAAWSAQAVDLYLSFYGEDFRPTKLSKKVWAVQRRIRIKKPRWVNVRLRNFNVKPAPQGRVVVQLVQDYRADNYRDKTKKQFTMKHTMDGWRILSEQSLAVIR